jgi:hypothetical protein
MSENSSQLKCSNELSHAQIQNSASNPDRDAKHLRFAGLGISDQFGPGRSKGGIRARAATASE